MALFTFKYFRCNVVWSAANCSFALTVELKLCGESEISDFDLHLVIQKKITKF